MTDSQNFTLLTNSNPVTPLSQHSNAENNAEPAPPATAQEASKTQHTLNSHLINTAPMGNKPDGSPRVPSIPDTEDFKVPGLQPSHRDHPQLVPVPELTNDKLLNLCLAAQFVESGGKLLLRTDLPIGSDHPTAGSHVCSSHHSEQPDTQRKLSGSAALRHEPSTRAKKEHSPCPATYSAPAIFRHAPRKSAPSIHNTATIERRMAERLPTPYSQALNIPFERRDSGTLHTFMKRSRSPPTNSKAAKNPRLESCALQSNTLENNCGRPTQGHVNKKMDIEKSADAPNGHCEVQRNVENGCLAASSESQAPSSVWYGRMGIRDIITPVVDPASTKERTYNAAEHHQLAGNPSASFSGDLQAAPPAATAIQSPPTVPCNQQNSTMAPYTASIAPYNGAARHSGTSAMRVFPHPMYTQNMQQTGYKRVPFTIYGHQAHIARPNDAYTNLQGSLYSSQAFLQWNPSPTQRVSRLSPKCTSSQHQPDSLRLSNVHCVAGARDPQRHKQWQNRFCTNALPQPTPAQATPPQVNRNAVQNVPTTHSSNKQGINLEPHLSPQTPVPSSIDSNRVYDLQQILKMGCKVLKGKIYNEHNHRVCGAPRENGMPCKRSVSRNACKWHGIVVTLNSQNTKNGVLDEEGSLSTMENTCSVEGEDNQPESPANWKLVSSEGEQNIPPLPQDPVPAAAMTPAAHTSTLRLRWDNEEHFWFLLAHETYGNRWSMIARVVQTRNTLQVQSHAQKYFERRHKQDKKKMTIHDLVLTSPEMQDILKGIPDDVKKARLALAYQRNQPQHNHSN